MKRREIIIYLDSSRSGVVFCLPSCVGLATGIPSLGITWQYWGDMGDGSVQRSIRLSKVSISISVPHRAFFKERSCLSTKSFPFRTNAECASTRATITKLPPKFPSPFIIYEGL